MARRWLTVVVSLLLVAWGLLAWWQYHQFVQERYLAQHVLEHQGDAIANALVGGIRSHRRLGRFFEEQIQAMLDEFAASENVVAVSLRSADGFLRLTAGDRSRLDQLQPDQPGWLPDGFLWERQFDLPVDATGPPPGRGPGFGLGGGRGWGAGQQAEAGGPLAAGGRLIVRLLLDDAHAQAQLYRSARVRMLLVVAGGLLLGALGLAWQSTLRLLEARARAQVLELEARRLHELSQAAAGLAHETRNPLGLIRGWVQRLSEGGLSADQRTQAQVVVEECDRLTARINQFIAFARPRPPHSEELELCPLVAELAALLAPDLEAKGLNLDQARVPRGSRVLADRELLRQALFNLVGNAVQFAPPGGRIEIALCGGPDRGLRIEVADRGPGVPPDRVEALFTPYFSTRPNGTGLGLAIVQQIAAVHGWQAGYTPRAGGGAVFWLDHVHGR